MPSQVLYNDPRKRQKNIRIRSIFQGDLEKIPFDSAQGEASLHAERSRSIFTLSY